MKRGTWLLAASLVFLGLLFLVAAGLGLHSRSMMGMMGNGRGMRSMSGMMWTMGLWDALTFLLLLALIIGVVVIAYRLRGRASGRCPNCQTRVQRDWAFCPECGHNLSSQSNRPST